MNLDKKITQIRIKHGMGQREFAERINATVSAVSNWENGRNKPNKERLKNIADLERTTVEELMSETRKEMKSMNNYYPDGMNGLPREPEILCYDFKGDPIRVGDKVWHTEGGPVHYEDAEEFLNEMYGRASEIDASGQ